MAYEVWEKSVLISGNGSPEQVCYVIDTAMDLCKTLSVGTVVRQVWRPKPGATPHGMWGGMEGEHIQVQFPKAYALVERDKQSTVRGWGIDGTWYDYAECKRCVNTGEDGLAMCPSCHGASFDPL